MRNVINGDVMNGQNMKKQRGGTFLGFVAGVVVGLGAALVVAVYVTKVPVPFLDRGTGRSAEQDVTELKKNKDWDPNAPLYGKNPAKPASASEVVLSNSGATTKDAALNAPVKAASSAAAGKPEGKPTVATDPLGDLVKAHTAGKEVASATDDPFNYFVQIGAFRTNEDAESQRAKLSLSGIETKISEREQAGRTVFRVRTGPYNTRDDAEKSKAKLDGMGLDTALVRVQR
jgi:cell division protein FtsN